MFASSSYMPTDWRKNDLKTELPQECSLRLQICFTTLKRDQCYIKCMFRVNSIETCILSRVKQIISPGWMHETSARTWCTGKTQRDWVEREVGGGIGMGNTCISKADSCQYMTKTTTIL